MDKDLFNYIFSPMNDIIPSTTVPQEVEVPMSHAALMKENESSGYIIAQEFTISYDGNLSQIESPL